MDIMMDSWEYNTEESRQDAIENHIITLLHDEPDFEEKKKLDILKDEWKILKAFMEIALDEEGESVGGENHLIRSQIDAVYYAFNNWAREMRVGHSRGPDR